jgi:hypothetical protein
MRTPKGNQVMPEENKENPVSENKNNDKELNFRMLEAKYKQQLAEERAARLEAEKKAQEIAIKSKQNIVEDDDNDDEPYVDRKRLEKKLAVFGQQTMQTTQSEIQKAVQTALYEERKQNWLKQNSDFYEIMNHADKLEQLDSEFAETILQMPDTFERQKLVYKSIKNLGLHKPVDEKKSDIQHKIDQNRRSPYYSPSGIGTSPYANAGDFSKQGQEQAYLKMQELKRRLGG